MPADAPVTRAVRPFPSSAAIRSSYLSQFNVATE
jgi:hypothetical protein